MSSTERRFLNHIVLSFFVLVLQIPELCSDQPTVITPADIYSHFTPPKQELKSILKKPSIEEKNKQTSEDKAISTQQAVSDVTKTETEKQPFDSQKVLVIPIFFLFLRHLPQTFRFRLVKT